MVRDWHGRAQSRNSRWSTATSPLWPWERCECRRILKDVGIRPRKMVASFQPRTLVASGRHTVASWESWWRMDAHSGVEPRPVWPTTSIRNTLVAGHLQGKWKLIVAYITFVKQTCKHVLKKIRATRILTSITKSNVKTEIREILAITACNVIWNNLELFEF